MNFNENDLSVTNSSTLKNIKSNNEFIDKNSSLIVKRVPPPVRRHRQAASNSGIHIVDKDGKKSDIIKTALNSLANLPPNAGLPPKNNNLPNGNNQPNGHSVNGHNSTSNNNQLNHHAGHGS